MMFIPALESGPNTDLAWVLYVIFGLLVAAVIVGALTSGGKSAPAPRRTSQLASPSSKRTASKRKLEK